MARSLVYLGVAVVVAACGSTGDRGLPPEPTGGCKPLTRLLGYSSSQIATWYAQNHFEPIQLRIIDLGTPKAAPPLVTTMTIDGKTYTGVLRTEAACILGDRRFGVDAAGKIFMLDGGGVGGVDYNAHTCTTSAGKVPCETSGTTNRFYVFPDATKYGGLCNLRQCYPIVQARGVCPEDSSSPVCHGEA